MRTLLSLLVVFAASACVGESDAPPPETTTVQQADSVDACESDCARKARYNHARCLRSGRSADECAAATATAWQDCEGGCRGAQRDCRTSCTERGKESFRACVRSGVARARCIRKARRKTAACARRCRPEPPPRCQSRCRDSAFDYLQRCLAQGHRADICRRRTATVEANCVAHHCAPRSCDDVRCDRGQRCRMNDDGPACVPLTCDDVRCDRGQRCQMNDDGPACVALTCDDVRCERGERCEMNDGGPACVALTCDDVRCERGQRCEMNDDGPACVALTCDDVRCERGERCQMNDDGPACVPLTCDDVRCERGQRCQMNDDGPACVALTCDDVQCERGERCEMNDDGPHCVPLGCDDIECRRGERCEMGDDGPYCRAMTCDDIRCGDAERCEMTDDGPACVPHTCDDVECPDGEVCSLEDGQPVCHVPEEPRDCVGICGGEADAIWVRCRENGGRIEECSNRGSDHNVRCQRACRDRDSCQRDSCESDQQCQLGFDDRAVCVTVRDQGCVWLCEEDGDAVETRCREEGRDWDFCAQLRMDHVAGCAGECMGNHVGCGDIVCPNTHHCQDHDGRAYCMPDQRPGCLTDCQNRGTEAYEQCVRDERPNAECEELGDQVIRDCSEFCPALPTNCAELDTCPNQYQCHNTDAGAVCIDAPPQCAWGCEVLRRNDEAVCRHYGGEEEACRQEGLLGYRHCVYNCRENR